MITRDQGGEKIPQIINEIMIAISFISAAKKKERIGFILESAHH